MTGPTSSQIVLDYLDNKIGRQDLIDLLDSLPRDAARALLMAVRGVKAAEYLSTVQERGRSDELRILLFHLAELDNLVRQYR